MHILTESIIKADLRRLKRYYRNINTRKDFINFDINAEDGVIGFIAYASFHGRMCNDLNEKNCETCVDMW